MQAAGRGEAQGMMGRVRQLTIVSTGGWADCLEEPWCLSLPANADGRSKVQRQKRWIALNPEMVKKARELEMQYMEEWKVRLKTAIGNVCMTETES